MRTRRVVVIALEGRSPKIREQRERAASGCPKQSYRAHRIVGSVEKKWVCVQLTWIGVRISMLLEKPAWNRHVRLEDQWLSSN